MADDNDNQENQFDREHIKNEIDKIIDEITVESVDKEKLKEEIHATLFKLISVNAGSLVKLSKLTKTMNDTVHLHSQVLIKYTKILHYAKKYMFILLFMVASSFVMSLIAMLYSFFS